MKSNYVSLSLETHLFFGRIMKEHSLFLLAGFPAKNTDYIKRADWFRMQFEKLLRETVAVSEKRVGREALDSGEIVTAYTLGAEQRTRFLTGIEIDSRITQAEMRLKEGCENESRQAMQMARQLNQRALRLTDGLIEFKEKIIKDMAACRLFSFNYKLLVEHILRERGCIAPQLLNWKEEEPSAVRTCLGWRCSGIRL